MLEPLHIETMVTVTIFTILTIIGNSQALDIFKTGFQYEYDFITESSVRPNDVQDGYATGYTYIGKFHVEAFEDNTLTMAIAVDKICLRYGTNESNHHHGYDGHKYRDHHYHPSDDDVTPGEHRRHHFNHHHDDQHHTSVNHDHHQCEGHQIDKTLPEFQAQVNELEKPFRVTYGKDYSPLYYQSENTDAWASNFKKSLATYFRVPVDKQRKSLTISEAFFQQNIEATYSLKRNEQSMHIYFSKHSNVFKDKSYYYGSDVTGSKCVCNVGDCQRELYDNPVIGKMIVREKTEELEHLEFTQMITSRPFGTYGYSFTSEVNGLFHLRGIETNHNQFLVGGSREDFTYEDPFFKHAKQTFDPHLPTKFNKFKELDYDLELVYRKCLELLRNAASETRDKQQHGFYDYLLSLPSYLEELNSDYLEQLYSGFENKDEMAAFINALTLSRSRHATLQLFKIKATDDITSHMVGPYELMSQITRVRNPDKALISRIFEHLRNFALPQGFDGISMTQDMFLPFGVLASKACQTESDFDDPTINEISRYLMDKVETHKNDPLGSVYAETLKNMDWYPNIAFFKNLFMGNYPKEVKSIALWALTPQFFKNPASIRPLLLKTLYDRSQQYGLRMETLSFILQNDDYESIYNTVKSIDNPDMLSYAWSVIDTIAKTNLFCDKQYEIARKIKENVARPQVEENYGSFARQFQYYDERHDYGHLGVLHIIQSAYSIIPEKIYGRFEVKSGGRKATALGMVVNIHNTESIIFSQKKYNTNDKTEYAPKEEDVKVEVKFMYGHQVFARFYLDSQSKDLFFSLETLEKELSSKLRGFLDVYDDMRSDYHVLNALGQVVAVTTQNPIMNIDKSTFEDFPANFLFNHRGVFHVSKTMYIYNPLMDIAQGSTQISTTHINLQMDTSLILGKSPSITIKFDPDQRILLDMNNVVFNLIFGGGDKLPLHSPGSEYLFEHGVSSVAYIPNPTSMCKYHQALGTHIFTVRTPCLFGMNIKTFMTHVANIFFVDSANNNEGIGVLLAGIVRMADYTSYMPDKERVNFRFERAPVLREIKLKYLGGTTTKFGLGVDYAHKFDVTVSMTDSSMIRSHIFVAYGFGHKLLENHIRIKISNDIFGNENEVCLNVHVHYGAPVDLLNAPENDNKAKATYKLYFGSKCDSSDASSLTLELIGTIPEEQRRMFAIDVQGVTEKDRIDLEDLKMVYDRKLSLEEIRDLCKSDISYLPVKSYVPITKFCYRHMYEASLLANQLVTITYNKLPAGFLELGDKLFSIIRVAYMPFWSKSSEISNKVPQPQSQTSGMLVIHRSASLVNKTATYKFNFPDATYRFVDIPFSRLPFLVMRSGRFPNFHRSYIRTNIMGSCDFNIHRSNVMESFVVPNELSSCPAVVAKDCSGKNIFVLKARRINHPTFQMEISLELNKFGKTLEIKPSDDSSKAKFLITITEMRKAPREVTVEEYMNYGIYVYDHSLIVDNLLSHGIMIGFDGVFLPVGVTTFHKGSVCGLCGEFRGRTGDILAPPMNDWAHKNQNFADQLDYASEVTRQWEEKC